MTPRPFHSCSLWKFPVVSGSKSLPSLPRLLPAFPPSAFCVPRKGTGCDAPATCFLFLLLLLLLLVLPPQPKRQLVLSMAHHGQSWETRLCSCVFLTVDEATSVVSWMVLCPFGGDCLLLPHLASTGAWIAACLAQKDTRVCVYPSMHPCMHTSICTFG